MSAFFRKRKKNRSTIFFQLFLVISSTLIGRHRVSLRRLPYTLKNPKTNFAIFHEILTPSRNISSTSSTHSMFRSLKKPLRYGGPVDDEIKKAVFPQYSNCSRFVVAMTEQ